MFSMKSGDLIYPYDITADDTNDISKYYKLTDSDQDTLPYRVPSQIRKNTSPD